MFPNFRSVHTVFLPRRIKIEHSFPEVAYYLGYKFPWTKLMTLAFRTSLGGAYTGEPAEDETVLRAGLLITGTVYHSQSHR